ncbi:MAG TPA: YIP1 family protein [Vineibacter sp.]|nr:YIP1 family protein [Vineibacter sp.]
MKELLERIFKYLPAYVPELTRLIARPKTTVARFTAGATDDLTHALVFVGITVAIGFVLQAPTLAKGHDFLTIVGSMIAFKIVAFLAFSAVIFGVMRLLGGNGEYLKTLAVYAYLVCPAYLAAVVLDLIGRGIVRSHDEQLAARLVNEPGLLLGTADYDAFFDKAPGLASVYVLVYLTQLVVLVTWFFLCWGALRQVHGLSRLRSTMAGVLAYAAAWVVAPSLNYLAVGIFGSGRPPLI